MAGAARIAEFFASVGFQADEKSLKSALTKVAAFGASVSVLAGGVFAALVGIAKAEADIAAQADKLGTSSERLEELRYVAEQTGSSADKLTSALESIASKNPRIKDTAAAFDLVSDRMRGMSELQRKLYAQRLGIDPTLIPMMTDDVAGLREEFRAMYAVAGTDAKAAAEESKGFLNELAKLKTLSGMLAKAVGLAFIGKIRRDIENLRRVIMENFGKIQRILQIVIGFFMRVAGAIGAFVYRIIKWAGQLVGWFDSLDDGQKKLVIGVGLLIAAWKMLNLAFLTTPLGMLITGLRRYRRPYRRLSHIHGGRGKLFRLDPVGRYHQNMRRLAATRGRGDRHVHYGTSGSPYERRQGDRRIHGHSGRDRHGHCRDRRHEESLFRIYGGAFSQPVHAPTRRGRYRRDAHHR